MDFRYIRTSANESWLDGGFGKTRYGICANGSACNLLRLSQASAVLNVSFNENFAAHLHLNFDAEPAREVDRRRRLDLIEGFASYRRIISSRFRLRARAGFFFPPASLENRDVAWTSKYSITSSAINSWIGEEVRVACVEAGMLVDTNGNQISFAASVFGKNDPAGSLLAWRGWTLQDRVTALGDDLPLPPLHAFEAEGLFPRQPKLVEPFREVDGRPGYYASLSWINRHFEANALHYRNRSKETVFDGKQYAWLTTFWNFGLSLPLPGGFELLTQYLNGSSKMGFGDMVNIDFYSAYILLSCQLNKNRFTVRYDDFRVEDKDAFLAQDNNNEDGSAWTAAYFYSLGEKQRVAAEYLRIESDRPARLNLGLSSRATDRQFQISYRLEL